MSRYLTEFAGTFFLVLTIGLTVVREVSVAPFAIGSVLAAFVYMGVHISGAHYNPAIGLVILVALAGAGSLADLWIYWVGPVAGAALALPVYRMRQRRGPASGLEPANRASAAGSGAGTHQIVW